MCMSQGLWDTDDNAWPLQWWKNGTGKSCSSECQLLSRLLLFRSLRGGLMSKRKLQERMTLFNTDDWVPLLHESNSIAETCGNVVNTQRMMFLGESRGRVRRKTGTWGGRHRPWQLDPDMFLTNVRSARDAAAGPSDMTAWTASLSSEVRNSPLTLRWCHRCEAGNRTGDVLMWTAQPSTRPDDVRSAPTLSCANATAEQDWSSSLRKLGADGRTRLPTSFSNSPRRRWEVCLVFFKSGQDRLGRCGGVPCWRAAVLELSRCRSLTGVLLWVWMVTLLRPLMWWEISVMPLSGFAWGVYARALRVTDFVTVFLSSSKKNRPTSSRWQCCWIHLCHERDRIRKYGFLSLDNPERTRQCPRRRIDDLIDNYVYPLHRKLRADKEERSDTDDHSKRDGYIGRPIGFTSTLERGQWYGSQKYWG